MEKRFILYRWLLAVWIVCGCSHSLSVAFAYDRGRQPASWGYPAGNRSQVFTVSFSGTSVTTVGGGSSSAAGFTNGSSQSIVTNRDVYPTYNFKSTSAFSSMVGNQTSFSPIAATRPGQAPRRANGSMEGTWDAPGDDDDPIGVTKDPVPVGEPLVLLFIAMLYALCLRFRRQQ